MSFHVPWADQAQLSEFSTDTNFIGTLRDCVRRFTALDAEARINALVIADTVVGLPGRSPTKILEQPELEALLALVDPEPISHAAVTALIEERLAL